MRILDLDIMKGPNCWSDQYNDLMVVRIDTERENFPEEERAAFIDRVKALFPALPKMEKTTDVAVQAVRYIFEHLVEKAETPTKYTEIKPTETRNIYILLLEYEIEKVSTFAIEAAVDIADAIAEAK